VKVEIKSARIAYIQEHAQLLLLLLFHYTSDMNIK